MKQAKNNSFSTVLFLLITGLLTPSVMAQQAAAQPHKFTFYGNLQIGLPRGEFQENVKDMGVGFGLGIGYHLGNSPLMIGAEARYSIYGHETRRQSFQQNPDVFAVPHDRSPLTANWISLIYPLHRRRLPLSKRFQRSLLWIKFHVGQNLQRP